MIARNREGDRRARRECLCALSMDVVDQHRMAAHVDSVPKDAAEEFRVADYAGKPGPRFVNRRAFHDDIYILWPKED